MPIAQQYNLTCYRVTTTDCPCGYIVWATNERQVRERMEATGRVVTGVKREG